MLTEAYSLLRDEFEKCLSVVGEHPQWSAYAREKWRHSMQVMGAGNYLVRRIQWLQNKSDSYIDMVKTAILLHDISRFAEITAYFNNTVQDYDHGAIGADFLRQISEYSDIRIWLPIRHHGHLIEDLYDDADYQNIADKNLQQEVELICFVIRDADKIANLRMLAYEPQIRPLFLGKSSYIAEVDGIISDTVRQYAFSDTTIPRDPRSTVADRVIGYLSWFKDINYQYAIDFCWRLGVIPRLYEILDQYCSDMNFNKQYAHFITDYLHTHIFRV